MNIKNSEVTYVINEYEKEVIVFNTTTCLRLFELGNDPTLLYLFYVKTAKIQGTNSIYALNSFCKKGLKWGDHKFNKAKKLLAEEGLIEQITKKDENGVITGHYVKIHYLQNNKQDNSDERISNKITTHAPTHKVDPPTRWIPPSCGSQETNALDKKGNALDKKGNALDKKENTKSTVILDLFESWNDLDIIKHRELTKSLTILIDKVLSFYPSEKIKEAMKNYKTVISSDEYFFSYKWSLKEFLQRGISKQGQEGKKGFIQFLSENDPLNRFLKNKISEIEKLRREFKPITVEYTDNLLDKEKNTYFGFSTDKLNNKDYINSILSSVKDNYNSGNFEYGDFYWTEKIIASIFFLRKSGYDMLLLKALLSIWKEMKPKFKRDALRMLEG